ncbi:MAG: Xaa-Pro peptidase family protein [Bacteroidota bacterium]
MKTLVDRTLHTAAPTVETARIAQIRGLLEAHDADAVFVSAGHDVRWATGFTGSNALLIVTRGSIAFLTDGRYDEQAKREVRLGDVYIVQGDLGGFAAKSALVPEGATALVQSDCLTVAAFEKLKGQFPTVDFVPVPSLLDAAVAAKSADEIERVRAAQAVTDDVFSALLPMIRPGLTEQALAAEITYAHLQRGASAMSFEPIVASGPNSALPHARPTTRVLQDGDVVLIDMGAYVEGYSSDMTRTLVLGQATDEVRQVYAAVLHAQEAAIEVAKAGRSGTELDAAARSVLVEAGYGDHFSHSLGHGVGLRVHEWPRLSQQVEHVLPVGATVTIEPGVYLPERFGVRIEDIIVLGEASCDNLTSTPKTLLEL